MLPCQRGNAKDFDPSLETSYNKNKENSVSTLFHYTDEDQKHNI